MDSTRDQSPINVWRCGQDAIMVRCQCWDPDHYVEVTYDREEKEFSFHVVFAPTETWKERLRLFFYILRHRTTYHYILISPAEATVLGDFLLKKGQEAVT